MDSQWDTNIADIQQFLMNLKSWAEISTIVKVKVGTAESKLSYNGTALRSHLDRKLGNAPWWILGTLSDYKAMWKRGQGQTIPTPMADKEIESINWCHDFYRQFFDDESAWYYANKYGKNPARPLNRMFPTNVLKSSWKDQYGISFEGHEKIMKKTMTRFLHTQKDSDFVSRPIASYLGATSHWQSPIYQDRIGERDKEAWELLLNAKTYNDFSELAEKITDSDWQFNMPSLIKEIFYLLTVFEIREPVIKLDKLYIKSQYHTTSDPAAMREEILESYDLSGDDEQAIREMSDAEIIEEYTLDHNLPHKYGGIVFHGSDIEVLYQSPRKREGREEIRVRLGDGAIPSNKPAILDEMNEIREIYPLDYHGQTISTDGWSISSDWFPIGLVNESRAVLNDAMINYGDNYDPKDIVGRLWEFSPYQFHTLLQIKPDPRGYPSTTCMIPDGNPEEPREIYERNPYYYTKADSNQATIPEEQVWKMKPVTNQFWNEVNTTSQTIPTPTVLPSEPPEWAVAIRDDAKAKWVDWKNSQPEISGLEESWMGLCSIDLEVDIKLSSSMHLINYVLGIPQRWVK